MKYLLLLTIPLFFAGCLVTSDPGTPQGIEPAVSSSESVTFISSFDTTTTIPEQHCITISGEEFCRDVLIPDDSLSSSSLSSSAVLPVDPCPMGYEYDNTIGAYKCRDISEMDYQVEVTYTSNDTTYYQGYCKSENLYTNQWIRELPIYQPYEEYLASITNEDDQKLVNAGKIYQIGTWKFVNEVDKGVHVYDNSDPTNPVYTTFITIPGNQDVAVKNNTLLADSYSNLLAIDFSDPENVTVLKDIKEMLTGRNKNGYEMLHPDSGLIVDWKVDTIYEVSCWGNNMIMVDYAMDSGMGRLEMSSAEMNMLSSDVKSVNIGQGGSLARFALSEDYLYAVTQSELVTFLVTDETNPKYSSRTNIGWWGIETVYMKEELLFVGSRDAMYIYDISNPSNPKQASRFSHVTSCDPVVVEGDYAYVTLRTGSGCRMGDTELEIIDVSDIYRPILVETYEMENPSGLGIHEDNLYVCDGKAGLKVYDITNTPDLDLINIVDTVNVMDLIVNSENLTLIGPAGMYQFDHTDPENLVEQSFVPAVIE